jgi:hypothetical protein
MGKSLNFRFTSFYSGHYSHVAPELQEAVATSFDKMVLLGREIDGGNHW